MSTLFFGEGNLGGDAEFHEFPNPDDVHKPYRLLRARVYFDNPVRQQDGSFRDRGGYWTTVELWNSSAAQWATLFRKGMRVVVHGKALIEEWTDDEGQAQVTDKIDAKLMAILPHRIAAVTLAPKAVTSAEDSDAEPQ